MPAKLWGVVKEHGHLLIIVAVVAVVSILVIRHEHNRLPPYIKSVPSGFDFQSSMESEQGRRFVEESIEAIALEWDKKELLERMPDEYLDSLNPEEIDKAFDIFRRVGKLKALNGSVVRMVETTSIPGEGEVFSSTYITDADFETGPAKITTTAVHRHDKWALATFKVNSEALFECR